MSQPPSPGRLRSARVLAAGLGLGLALVLLAALAAMLGADPAEVGRALGRLPVWAWVAIALVQAGLILAAALKWTLILARTAPALPRIGTGAATAATTLGTLAGQVVPLQLVTPALRAWVARRRGIPVPVALGSSALEQLFDLIILAAFALAAWLPVALALPPATALRTGLGTALLALVALTAATRPAWRLLAEALAATARPLQGRAAAATGALARGARAAAALEPRVLTWLTGLSALRYAGMAGMNVTILHALAPGVPAAVLLAAFPLVLLLTALPVLPAGLGAVELTWTGTLAAAGLPADEAVELALTLRIATTAGFLAAVPLLLAPLLAGPDRGAMA